MTLDLALPLHARRAAIALEGFDPDPLGQHQVGVGETIFTIAALWYGPARAGLASLIVEQNFLISTRISIGQVLTIPRIGWRAL